MKKKHRDITVDKVQYAWTIKDNVDGDGSNEVSIWKDKKIIHTQMLKGTIPITPALVKGIIKGIDQPDPWEHIIPNLQEHRVLKECIIFDTNERKADGYKPRWNAILESYTEDGDEMGTRLLAARIDINGLTDFTIPPENPIGIQRASYRESIKRPNHPMNIERITFIINNEEIEFVRCDG